MKKLLQWLRSMIALLWHRLLRALAPLCWQAKLPIGIGTCAIFLLILLWVVSSVSAFVTPATSLYSTAYLGSTSAYCTYWAADHEHVGTPTPGPCGVMLVGVDMSPVYTPLPHNTSYVADEYAPGNCTYWTALRRGQAGDSIPNTWGDAYMWADRASAGGYTVDHTPASGAIMQTAAGSLGHVAYVESVESNGTWHISEMNVLGLGIIDNRTMPAAAATSYYFIH